MENISEPVLYKTEGNLYSIIKLAEDFPMHRIVERYAKENNLDKDIALIHERELKRFLTICAVGAGDIGMRGPVDELWHTFIMFTVEYEEFCKRVAGDFIHHVPTDESISREAGQKAAAKFDEAYKVVFGHEPPVDVWPKLGAEGDNVALCYHRCSKCSTLPEVKNRSLDVLEA